MSPRDNDFENKISVVILCAGKGKRLKELTRNFPKPLLRIESLGNVPILRHTIYNVVSLGIKRLFIVIGYLGSKINDFIQNITDNNRRFRKKIEIIDAGIDYKKGPLFSFLSITRNSNAFKANSIYVVIPGDTIFDFNLLQDIFSFILKNHRISQENQIIFYRNIETIKLKEEHRFNLEGSPKFISLVEIERNNNEEIVKKIYKKNIEELFDYDKVPQVIPVFTFNYNFVNKIIECEKKNSFQTIREIVNYMIENGEKILAANVKTKHNFYDIDNISDIKYAEHDIIRKKKAGQ